MSSSRNRWSRSRTRLPTWWQGRRPRPGSRGTYILLIILLLLTALWRSYVRERPIALEDAGGIYRVTSVVDGDTLRLDNDQLVRLIGVDTPELRQREPFSADAAAFTFSFVASADFKVRLTFDTRRHDKYGRLLAYVWADDRLLNEELVQHGLARAELQYSYSSEMKERFRRAEEAAKKRGDGIWSTSDRPKS